MAEQFPGEKLTPFDALTVINSERFQNATTYVNNLLMQMGDGSDLTESEYNAMEESVDTLNSTFFGAPWLERAAKLIALVEDADEEDDEYDSGVITVESKFIGLLPEVVNDSFTVEVNGRSAVVQDMTYMALALCFEDDQYRHTIPMNHVLGLTVNIPKPREEARTEFECLQIDCSTLHHLIGTELFLSYDIDDQRSQLNDVIGKINANAPFLDKEGRYSVKITRPDGERSEVQGTTLSIYLPGLEKRRKPYRSLSDFKFGTELRLLALDTVNNIAHELPITSVTDIQTTSAPEVVPFEPEEEGVRRDVLATVLANEAIRAAIAEAEEALNDCADEDERQDLRSEYSSLIASFLEEEFFDLSYELTGHVFREHLDDTITNEIESHEYATAVDIDIKKINGRWRVVLALEVETGKVIGTDMEVECESIFIIPSPAYMLRLESVEYPDFTIGEVRDETLTQLCADSIENTKHLISTNHFSRARLERQIHLLRDELAPLQAAIDDMTTNEYQGKVACMVSGYYSIDSSLTDDYTGADIAAIPYSEFEEPVPIEGDYVVADIPELNEPRTTKFTSTKDFPLSKGEPMIVLENTLLDMTYYIPASAFKLMSPFPAT